MCKVNPVTPNSASMNRGGYLEWISANVLQTARVYWRVPVLFMIYDLWFIITIYYYYYHLPSMHLSLTFSVNVVVVLFFKCLWVCGQQLWNLAVKWGVYDINHISALWIKNNSESDSRGSRDRIPVKPQNFFLGFLCNCFSCFTVNLAVLLMSFMKISFSSVLLMLKCSFPLVVVFSLVEKMWRTN